MENAAQAIKMAGAIIVFTMALAVVMNAFTAARAAADGVMNKKDYTKTYYAADETAEETNDAYGNYDLAVQKIVGIDEVIATMYNYRKEGTTILFYTAKADSGAEYNLNSSVYDISGSEIKPLILYYTEALPYALAKSSLGLEKYSVNNSSGTSSTAAPPSLSQRAIYGLSSSDEITRNEPWIGDDTQTRLFIDDLIAGREAASVIQRTPRLVIKNNTAHYYNRLSTFVKGVYVSNNSAFTIGRNNYLSYGFCPSGAPSNNSASTSTPDTSLGNNPHSNFGTPEMNSISNFLGFDKNARFVERIGEYDYKSRIVDSSGTLRDEGTVELDNGEIVEADITVSRRKIIQFIYLTD